MSFKCGIVGLPNVGKSTLFNALTNSSKAQAENFPFCTIDPNIGIVSVPDERLNKISTISKSAKTINAAITFVDIAGLVKGASKGEGLGNKFLSHVREVDAIIHLTRCFESEKIQNVNKNVDPIRDLETVNIEILLADLESIQKITEKNKKRYLSNEDLEVLKKASELISGGKNPSVLKKEYDQKILNRTGLLSLKPKIIVCNIDEKSLPDGNEFSDACRKAYPNEKVIIVCANIEQELTELNPKDRNKFMKDTGIIKTGLESLIRAGYDKLELLTFFTSGNNESRAWTVKKNSKAPDAAGVIHSDFKKGFIKAETVSCKDFIELNGFNKCKLAGKLRLEGKDYIVKDGDILFFRFSI